MDVPRHPIAEGRTRPRPERRVIPGDAVRLEPLGPGHAAALHAANRADDRIWDFLPYGPFADPEAYRDWVARVAAGEDPLFFALVDTATGRPGGVASLMRIDPGLGTIEVGHICLSPGLQRTLAASEAIFRFADWVFAAGYRRFEWKCDARNLRSRRAAQRFGFSFEGVFRNHMIVKGRNRDTAWFAMTDGDWTCLAPTWRRWLAAPGEGSLGAATAPCRVASDPAL